MQENHIFQAYVNLMIRVASKADLMVIDDTNEKVKYLEISAKYYHELIKLLQLLESQMPIMYKHRAPEEKRHLAQFIKERSELFNARMASVN